MKKIYLFGHPVSHSQSPALHNRWLHKAEIAAQYEALSIHPKDLESAMKLLRSDEILGCNVTIPHKQAIIPYLDGLSQESQAIGAVNTVVKVGSKLIGHNTDALALLRDLEAKNVHHQNRNVLIFGNGGATKAVRWGLERNGCKVQVWSRSKGWIPAFAGKTHNMHRLIINATPYGMAGSDPNEFLDKFQFRPTQTFYDLIYNPSQTILMRRADHAGCQSFNGYGMLVEQARLSFKLWTGILPEGKHLY